MRFSPVKFPRSWLVMAMPLLVTLPSSASANEPGGGSTGANVTMTDGGSTVTLSNGIISATITKASATVTSMTFNGVQTVGATVYFSMDGNPNYENPAGCVLSVTANTPDMIDIALKENYATVHGIHAVDWELHYVLRRGAKGLYVYALLEHQASYPNVNIGEWRMVWKLPQNSTDFYFENGYVDDLRYHEFPSVSDLANDRATSIAEITMMNTGRRAGHYYGKYEFGFEYAKIGAWGHASDVHGLGTWIVIGGDDFFNDGPTKQDLTIDTNYHLIHFGRNHFNASSTIVPAGTAWKKMYGPYLLYCNAGANGAECWADAKAQAQAERSAWPYPWATGNAEYPPASARGAVSGRYLVNDPLKPGVSGANAWVGLAQPDTTGTYASLYGAYNWQFDSLHYQYWAQADAGGNFTIPNVRPGNYTLYAFSDGATGEFSKANVAVAAGQTNAQGSLTRNISRTGSYLAWEIGVPDRNATEFRHGTDYYVPFQWKNFATEWPNPLVFNANSGNWATGWNYTQGVYEVGGTDTATGTLSSWKWNVNFNLASKPASGNALLTIAFAGAHSSHLYVYVNSTTTKTADFYPPYASGNGLIRQTIHGKYGVSTITVPVSALNVGANTITIQQASASGNGNYAAYDYLSLEMPGPVVSQQPAAGRSLTWAGGQSANAWDSAAANWLASGTAAAFVAGDSVTFSDSGAANATVNLANILRPTSVAFNTAQNYVIDGFGSLSGTMALTKSGTGALTVTNFGPNTFTGGGKLNGGAVVIDTPAALGTGALVFNGGELRLAATAFPLANTLSFLGPGKISTLGGANTFSGVLSGNSVYSLALPAGASVTATGNSATFNGTLALLDAGVYRFDQGANTWGGTQIAFDLGTAGTVDNHAAGAATVYLGSLAGGSSARVLGSDQSGAFTDTYLVGARNAGTIFSGQIKDGTGAPTPHTVALTKSGTGTLTLNGASTFRGATTIASGTLRVPGSLNGSNLVEVLNGATLDLAGTLTVNQVIVRAGGKLIGYGNITGPLINQGTVALEAGAGQILAVNGSITNTGTFRVANRAGLQVSGTFTNSGALDLLTAGTAPPANLVNTGTVLTPAVVKVDGILRSNGVVQLTIRSYQGHSYRLQTRASLTIGDWSDVGAAEAGTGGILTLSDSSASADDDRFYRILIFP